jgi:hypothetical protein
MQAKNRKVIVKGPYCQASQGINPESGSWLTALKCPIQSGWGTARPLVVPAALTRTTRYCLVMKNRNETACETGPLALSIKTILVVNDDACTA